MRQISNVHTHSTWCDGTDTPRQMADAAIALGFTDLGFSSHAPVPHDISCPGVPSEADYVGDIRKLADEYEDKLNISCGIEQDMQIPIERSDYDYIIGSSHYLVSHNFPYVSVDGDPAELRRAIEEDYGGDALAMVKDYYQRLAANIERCQPAIVGHFDLVTKHNRGNVLFDEESAAYQNTALEAFEHVLNVLAPYGGMVEVNTGAMARGLRDSPYLAPFLTRYAAEKGGRLIITTDCHDRRLLGAGYDVALAQIRAAGFRSMAVLKDGRFIDIDI